MHCVVGRMIGGDGEISGFSVECPVGTGIVLYSVDVVDVFPSEDVQPRKSSSESSCAYIDFDNRGILFTTIVKNIFQCRTIQSFRTNFILNSPSCHGRIVKNCEHVFAARVHSDASSILHYACFSALVGHSHFVRTRVLHHECGTGGE